MGSIQRLAFGLAVSICGAGTLRNTLVAGESIKLVQFGVLVVWDKSPRRGRNPRTGESMTITERQMITFRPSKRLREQMNR